MTPAQERYQSYEPASPPQEEEMARFLSAKRETFRSISPPQTCFASPILGIPLQLNPSTEGGRAEPECRAGEPIEQEEGPMYNPPTPHRNEQAVELHREESPLRCSSFAKNAASRPIRRAPLIEDQVISDDENAKASQRVNAQPEHGAPAHFGGRCDRTDEEDEEEEEEAGEHSRKDQPVGNDHPIRLIGSPNIMARIKSISRSILRRVEQRMRQNLKNYRRTHAILGNCLENREITPQQYQVNGRQDNSPQVPAQDAEPSSPNCPLTHAPSSFDFDEEHIPEPDVAHICPRVSPAGASPLPVMNLGPIFDAADNNDQEEENPPAPTPVPTDYAQIASLNAEGFQINRGPRNIENTTRLGHAAAEGVDGMVTHVGWEDAATHGRQIQEREQRQDEEGGNNAENAEEGRGEGRACRRGTKRTRCEIGTGYWLRSRKPASLSKRSRKSTYWLRPSRK